MAVHESIHIDIKNGVAAIRSLQRESKKAFDEITGSIKRVEVAVGAVFTSYAMSRAVEATVGQAIKLQSAFTGMAKTFPGTAAEMAKVQQQLRDMSKNLPFTAAELAKVAENAGQLGVKAKDMVQFTRTMADLGVTTNLSADEAATSLARFANIMANELGPQYDKIGSTIVALGNNFATTEREISEIGTRLAAAGKLAGLAESDILAFGTALSSVGVEAEAGGTAFSKVFQQVHEAVLSGSESLQVFASVAGTSVEGFRQAFEKDAAGAIASFVTGLGEAKNAYQILDSLGMDDARLKRALLSTAEAGDLLTNALTLGRQAWTENNALTIEAEKRYADAASQLKILGNILTDVGSTIGSAVLPYITDLVERMREATQTEEFQSGVRAAAEAFGDFAHGVFEAGQTIADMIEGLLDSIRLIGGDESIGALEVLGAAFELFGRQVRHVIAGVELVMNNLGIAAIQTARLIGMATPGNIGKQFVDKTMGSNLDTLMARRSDLKAQMGELGNPRASYEIGKAVAAVKSMHAEQRNASRSASELSRSHEDVARRAAAVASAVDSVGTKSKKMTEAQREAKREAKEYADALERANDTLFEPMSHPLLFEMEDSVRLIDKANDSYQDMAASAKEWAAEMAEAMAASAQAAQEARMMVGSLATDLISGVVTAGNALKTLGRDLLGGIMGGTQGAGGGLIGSILGGISGSSGIGKFLSGGGLSNAIGGITNKLAGSIVGPLAGFGSKAFPAIAGAMSGALSMGIGTAISIVGPKIFSGLKKLFGGKPEWQKVTEQIKGELGVSLSEATAKAIESTKKKMGVSRTMAGLINLDAIVGEANIGKDNFAGFATKALQSLEKIKNGAKGSAEAAEALKGAYSQLIPKAEELGMTGSKAFVAMIVGARKAGQEIPAAMEFTKKRLHEAVDGLGKFLTGLDKVTDPERLRGISSIGAAVFDAFAQLPGGLRAAVGELGDQLDVLAERYTKLGIEIPASLGHAIDLRNFAKNNAELIAGVEGLTQVARGLGETGFFTADAFNAIGAEAVAAFTQLTVAGQSERDALNTIAPILQEIVNEHIRNGKAIDEETQKLLDQAKGYGLITEQGTDLASKLQGEFDRLIEALSIGFGKTFPDSVARGAAKAQQSINGLQATANGKTYSMDPSVYEVYGPKETHAAGGIVGPGGGYAGAGEVVFSRPAVENASGATLLSTLNTLLAGGGSGGGLQGGGSVTIVIEKDGRQAKVMELRQMFGDRLIRVPAEVVG